jgi:hypothetical protein
MGGQKFAKLFERPFDIPIFRMLHRQAVTGERVRWILGENFVKQSDAIHKFSF